MKTTRLRREKEVLLSQSALLEESTKQSDQDRHLMLNNLELERTKLNALRSQRMIRLGEKQKVFESGSILAQQWDNHSKFQNDSKNRNARMKKGIYNNNSIKIYRDTKGVPTRMPYDSVNLVHSEMDNKNNWMKFGDNISTHSNPPVVRRDISASTVVSHKSINKDQMQFYERSMEEDNIIHNKHTGFGTDEDLSFTESPKPNRLNKSGGLRIPNRKTTKKRTDSSSSEFSEFENRYSERHSHMADDLSWTSPAGRKRKPDEI